MSNVTASTHQKIAVRIPTIGKCMPNIAGSIFMGLWLWHWSAITEDGPMQTGLFDEPD
jgi:hypothetical protein